MTPGLDATNPVAGTTGPVEERCSDQWEQNSRHTNASTWTGPRRVATITTSRVPINMVDQAADLIEALGPSGAFRRAIDLARELAPNHHVVSAVSAEAIVDLLAIGDIVRNDADNVSDEVDRRLTDFARRVLTA